LLRLCVLDLQLSRRFPSLSLLSLDQTLDREKASDSYIERRRSAEGMASYRRKRAGLEPWVDVKKPASVSVGGGAASASLALAAAENGTIDEDDDDDDFLDDRRTSPVGWAALLIPRGLFSLKVNSVCLGYDSYALMSKHVTELHCKPVLSPAERALAAARAKDPEISAKTAASTLKRRVAKYALLHGDRGPAMMAQDDAAMEEYMRVQKDRIISLLAREKARSNEMYLARQVHESSMPAPASDAAALSTGSSVSIPAARDLDSDDSDFDG
jgi:hypothetical protein